MGIGVAVVARASVHGMLLSAPLRCASSSGWASSRLSGCPTWKNEVRVRVRVAVARVGVRVQ